MRTGELEFSFVETLVRPDLSADIFRLGYEKLPPRAKAALKRILKTPADCRRSIRMFEHHVRSSAQLVNVVPGITPAVRPMDDHALVARLMQAYRLATGEDHRSGESMWTEFFWSMHGAMHETFLGDDVAAAASILRDPGKTNLFYGFDSLALEMQKFASSGRWQKANALSTADSFARLAEITGACKQPYHEAFSVGYGKPQPFDSDKALSALDNVMGCKLTFPVPFADEHGLQTSRGVVSYRVPQALYQAYRIRELTHGKKNPSVLEIGGGLGRTAYYAKMMGISDYTIIDLPLSSLSQGYFLGRTLGDDAVALLGESGDNNADRIKLASPRHFLAGQKHYDLIVNVDSLTEMSREVANAYLDRIIAGGDAFLSINHEFNPFTVRELIRDRALSQPFTRALYPMRDGYVEETIQLKD
jgi:hypothetical protein